MEALGIKEVKISSDQMIKEKRQLSFRICFKNKPDSIEGVFLC